MKQTHNLTFKEYPYFTDRNSALMKTVNYEAELLYPTQRIPTPKVQIPKVVKGIGLYNFIKNFKP